MPKNWKLQLAEKSQGSERHRERNEAALGQLIIRSCKFINFYRQMERYWDALRTLRLAAIAMSHELNDKLSRQLPGSSISLLGLAQRDQPLARYVSSRVDDRVTTQWTEATAQLSTDPDTRLPFGISSGNNDCRAGGRPRRRFHELSVTGLS
jgi:hypothetical protein